MLNLIWLQRLTHHFWLRVLLWPSVRRFDDVNIIHFNIWVVFHNQRLFRGRLVENTNTTALWHNFLQVVRLVMGERLEQLRLVILESLFHRDRLTIHSLSQVIEHLLLHILGVFYSVQQLGLYCLKLPNLVLAGFYFALLSTKFV